MAPSPSLRRSPGREPRADNHKRGRSLESGLSLREKDDDLALFSEMHRREQENFLLQSSDDFEDVFSMKLKSLPDFKLGITIPVRGESSDLLNVDGDKNDYDWLLTPPETPLFPSLDDEPAAANPVHNGRPRSRPVSTPRSSMTEKSYRSSRGSGSPQRLSLSPRPGSRTAHGRPSSAPHSSPTPNVHHSTSLRRPSPPPIKPSTPPLRSSTPSPRRTSIGSGGAGISTGVRGTSPVRTARGNSASPKVRAWQSNIPGFSLEAPPNLRTSLADRPVSYVRGSSPASRNSRDSSSKMGRQSISPAASRSVSSFHIHERDRLSSYGKASPASSVEDDADSLHSVPVSSLDQSVPRRVISGFPNNRPSGFSKKPTKTISPNSAPKRYSDSALRQMNMFRPLLSSVPSTTFHSGKASSSHRAMGSLNSSFTSSNNASSDQATGGAPDTEGSDQYQDDMTSECEQEAFRANEFTTRLETQDGLLSDDHDDHEFQSHLGDLEEFSHEDALTSKALYIPGDSMKIGSPGNSLLCSRCGCRYLATEVAQNDISICLECQLKEEISTVPAPVMSIGIAQNSSYPLKRMSDEHEQQKEVEPRVAIGQWPETEEMGESWNYLQTASQEENVNADLICCGEPTIDCLQGSPPALVAQVSMQVLSERLEKGQYLNVSGLSDMVCQGGELQKSADGSRAKVNMAEGVGISVLLKRSSSGKGPILQSRNITVSAISYEDSSYARDSTTSMRSSIGYGSASTSSSMDLAVSRHAETLMQRQLSSKRSDMSSKPQSNESTYSGTSVHVSQAVGTSTSTYGEDFEVTAGDAKPILDGSSGLLPESLSASVNAELLDIETFLSGRALPDDVTFSCSTSCREKDADIIEMSSYNVSTQSEGNSLASIPAYEEHVLHEIDKPFLEGVERVAYIEDQDVILETSVEENTKPDDGADGMEITEILDDNSLVVVSETDIDDFRSSSPVSQTDITVGDDSQQSSITLDQHEGIKDSVPFSGDSGLLHGIVGKLPFSILWSAAMVLVQLHRAYGS
ncbi:hypothetical protein Dimus_015221 [Dionaea muscipula]